MTQAKPTSFPLRLSNRTSKFETTPERLKDIAEFLGVSQNKAAAYAINQLWEHLVENEEMLEELEFKRHGVKVGNVTYLNETEEAIAKRRANLKAKKPLPHILDESLESNFLFAGLPEQEQAIIRAASTPDQKRRLLAEAVDRFCAAED
jgi:serine phosphatase RsbU (regulator of sigma subunit)